MANAFVSIEVECLLCECSGRHVDVWNVPQEPLEEVFHPQSGTVLRLCCLGDSYCNPGQGKKPIRRYGHPSVCVLLDKLVLLTVTLSVCEEIFSIRYNVPHLSIE